MLLGGARHRKQKHFKFPEMRIFECFLWILRFWVIFVLSDSEQLYRGGGVFWQDTPVAWELDKCLIKVYPRSLPEHEVRVCAGVGMWIFRLGAACVPSPSFPRPRDCGLLRESSLQALAQHVQDFAPTSPLRIGALEHVPSPQPACFCLPIWGDSPFLGLTSNDYMSAAPKTNVPLCQ